MPIKITGPRSLHTKLVRLAADMQSDAERVRADDGDSNLALSLVRIGADAAQLAKYLEPRQEAEPVPCGRRGGNCQCTSIQECFYSKES